MKQKAPRNSRRLILPPLSREAARGRAISCGMRQMLHHDIGIVAIQSSLLSGGHPPPRPPPNSRPGGLRDKYKDHGRK